METTKKYRAKIGTQKIITAYITVDQLKIYLKFTMLKNIHNYNFNWFIV